MLFLWFVHNNQCVIYDIHSNTFNLETNNINFIDQVGNKLANI
jgi:hypothetical protein